MHKLYSAALYLVSLTALHSQDVRWQRDIPSSTQALMSGLSMTIDRQFLVSGSAIQASGGASSVSGRNTGGGDGYDYHLVKLGQDGAPVWDKYYAGGGHDFLNSTAATAEGGFIIAGTSSSGIGGDKTEASIGGTDAWILKLDGGGAIQWQRTLGTERDDDVSSVVQSADLGYFVSGSIQSYSAGFGSKDAWVARLDKDGNVLNQVLLGGAGLEEVERIIPTKDGGALLCIYSRSGDASQMLTEKQSLLAKIDSQEGGAAGLASGALSKGGGGQQHGGGMHIKTLYAKQGAGYGEGDYWIVKLDKDGKLQWQRSFGGNEDDHVRAVANTSSGYLVAGESRSRASGNKTEAAKDGSDIWTLALDENGDELWQKSFSFGSRDVVMSLDPIRDKEGRDKGYLVGGYTQAEGQVGSDDETFWMLYIDKKGQEVWRKHVKGKSKKKEERLVAARLSNDGAYILAGTSAEELGRENWKIVSLGDRQVEELVERQQIRVYPNPVEEYCYVEIGEKFKEAAISIYDMAGRVLQSTTTKTAVTRLDTSILPQGAYIITATAEKLKLNSKIVKK